uniref:Ribosomal protein L16 n=1 Tax=Ascaris lumbricoides TaxID=6252 RepID=A0A0M3IA06_ASCLU
MRRSNRRNFHNRCKRFSKRTYRHAFKGTRYEAAYVSSF